MSNSKNSTKSSRVSRATDLIAGTKKRFPNANDTLAFGGATYTVAQVIAMLQNVVDLRTAVDQAKATSRSKVAAERSQSPPLVAVLDGFTEFVKNRFGTDAEALGDFGLKPPKATATQTAEEKAVAAAKRRATREARHTMGPVAKQEIKGNISAELVVTPMTSTPVAEKPPAAAGSNGAQAPANGSASNGAAPHA